MSKERVQLSSCRCLVYGLAYMRVFTRVHSHKLKRTQPAAVLQVGLQFAVV